MGDESLLNRRFCRLLVVGHAVKGGSRAYQCDCICENKVIVTEEDLLSGLKTSCGCLQKDKMRYNNGYLDIGHSGRVKDLTGIKLGRLIVIKPTRTHNKRKFANWLCRCKCGEMLILSSADIMNKKVKSCGKVECEQLAKMEG